MSGISPFRTGSVSLAQLIALNEELAALVRAGIPLETGLVALGKLHPFEDGVVLPHERTFPKVVDDRLRLLSATRSQLESLFLEVLETRIGLSGEKVRGQSEKRRNEDASEEDTRHADGSPVFD